MERKNMWKQYTAEQLNEVEEVSKRYKDCLDAGKTERECVSLIWKRVVLKIQKSQQEIKYR